MDFHAACKRTLQSSVPEVRQRLRDRPSELPLRMEYDTSELTSFYAGESYPTREAGRGGVV